MIPVLVFHHDVDLVQYVSSGPVPEASYRVAEPGVDLFVRRPAALGRGFQFVEAMSAAHIGRVGFRCEPGGVVYQVRQSA